MNKKSIASGFIIGALVTAVFSSKFGFLVTEGPENMLARCEKSGWAISITRTNGEMVVECNNLNGVL